MDPNTLDEAHGEGVHPLSMTPDSPPARSIKNHLRLAAMRADTQEAFKGDKGELAVMMAQRKRPRMFNVSSGQKSLLPWQTLMLDHYYCFTRRSFACTFVLI